MNMKAIDYKAEVLKVYPTAVCKKIGIDTGHSTTGRYVVFEIDSVLVGDAITYPSKTVNKSWIQAYDNLVRQNKLPTPPFPQR